MRVAFLGLGIMGHAMATNLVKAGHEVTVWNRTPGKLVEGAGVAPTPGGGGAGRGSGVAVRVGYRCGGECDFRRGWRGGVADEGMIIADSSTISPSATVKFAERVGAKGRELGGRADDGIEDRCAGRDVSVHRGRERRAGGTAEAVVRSDGEEDFPHGRDRQGAGHQACDEFADRDDF